MAAYCPIYLIGFGSGLYYYYGEECQQHLSTMITSPNALSPLGCGNYPNYPCVQVGGAYAASGSAEQGAIGGQESSNTLGLLNGIVVKPDCGPRFATSGGHDFSNGWFMNVPNVVVPQHQDCWFPCAGGGKAFYRLFTLYCRCNSAQEHMVPLRIGLQLSFVPNLYMPQQATAVTATPLSNVATVECNGQSYTTFTL